MLRSTHELQNYAIQATDGLVGHVKDLYFDDVLWVARYLVVDTGSWLDSRKVLITPVSVQHPDWSRRVLPVSITCAQVRHSPDIDTAKPVSRQHETDYFDYYGYPYYWGGDGLWGSGLSPYVLAPSAAGYLGAGLNEAAVSARAVAVAKTQQARHRDDDPHLRSTHALAGYHVHATDGDIGHVDEFLIDVETWAIRYVVVNTSNWWLGHRVLLSPHAVTAVHWADRRVTVHVTREAVKQAPVYDSTAELDRHGEIALHEHYGWPFYWAEGKLTGVRR